MKLITVLSFRSAEHKWKVVSFLPSSFLPSFLPSFLSKRKNRLAGKFQCIFYVFEAQPVRDIRF